MVAIYSLDGKAVLGRAASVWGLVLGVLSLVYPIGFILLIIIGTSAALLEVTSLAFVISSTMFLVWLF
ncbi:MAG: hypothetical protein R3293_23500 [Candidatus Promineifilaceae bacterium]|nr:hypothetical protein [Candidatus Promineifilaceae bacterium]